jgi:hypothetical protein
MKAALLGLLLWASLPAAAPAPQSVWIWEVDAARMLGEPAFAARVVDVLQTHRVGTLYLYAEGFEGGNPGRETAIRYRSLLSSLHSHGFRVEALLESAPRGTTSYVLPEFAAEARTILQGILEYDREAPPGARFDGIHLDIEPYTMEAWTEASRASLAAAFLDRSAEWVATIHASAPALRVGAAIPFWYDGLPVRWRGRLRPLSEHVQNLYDYVAVMDYRNRAGGPDGIVALAQAELAYGDRIGRPVVIGLETGDAKPDKITFHGLGARTLAREMATARKAFAVHPSFSGFALHHLSTWMTLLGSR